MALSLESLSNELLDQVFSYVDITHRPTLKALALVNHRSHALVRHFLFSTLRLHICVKTSFNSVNSDQDSIPNIVKNIPVGIIQHTRYLFIEGLPRSEDRYPTFWSDDSVHVFDSFFDSVRYNWEQLHVDNRSPHPRRNYFVQPIGSVDELKWKPLAGLIARMPMLREVTYNSGYKLAQCVLDAIHQIQPRARLHHNTFHLPSLENSETFDLYSDLDEHSLAIASSPCLDSISAGLSRTNIPIFKATVAQLAPNVQHIHTFAKPEDYRRTRGCFGNVRLPGWKGFQINSTDTSKHAKTKPTNCLRLGFGDMENWHDIVSFSKLQCFDLFVSSPDQLTHLVYCDFSALETLVLDIGDSDFRLASLAYQFDRPASSLLASLPPLKAVKVTGAAGPLTFKAILEHHGRSLQRLHFVPRAQRDQFVLDLAHIKDISRYAPILEELTIKIPRTQGDEREVAAYQALGSIPRLQSLHLLLDASMYGAASSTQLGRRDDATFSDQDVPNDPSFNISEQEIMTIKLLGGAVGLRKGFARKAFINCAMNEALARSIFKAISAGKPLSGSLALEKLGIRIVGPFDVDLGRSCDLERFRGLAVYIARSWVVERSASDDCRDELMLTDVTRRSYGLLSDPNKLADDIYWELWPNKTAPESSNQNDEANGKTWLDHWHSFPLHGS